MRGEQMTDSKAGAVVGTGTADLTAREAALAAALSGVVLPDLTRIVCEYARRCGHRFDAANAPSAEQITVSADGLSFGTIAQPAFWGSSGSFIVWSRYTLSEGAQRWSIRIPIGQKCWMGVADVRTRTVPTPGEVIPDPDSVYAGNFSLAQINFYSSMKNVPAGAHAALHDRSAFARAPAAMRYKPTVVQCTFDDAARTLRMEIAGEPEAGVLIIPHMPAAQFLCPIVMHTAHSLKEAALFTIESEDE
jgi:hypothetical protein